MNAISLLNNSYFSPLSNKREISFSSQNNTMRKQPTIKPAPKEYFFNSTIKEQEKNFFSWAQKTDFLKSQLPQILGNKENKIGSGFQNVVYKIPRNENFLIRMRKSSEKLPENIDFSKFEIKDVRDKNLKINIGQSIARLSYTDVDTHTYLNYEIIKKQQGKSLGVPPSSVLINEDTGCYHPGVVAYEDISRKRQYADSLKTIAEFPTKSYEELISNLLEAESHGYKFDSENSNNFLVDKDTQAINLIDMDKISTKKDITKHNELGNALYALTNINYFSTYLADDSQISNEDKNDAIENTITVIEKYTDAMKNLGVKFSTDNGKLHQLLWSLPFTFFCRTNNDEEKWQKLDEMGLVYKEDSHTDLKNYA